MLNLDQWLWLDNTVFVVQMWFAGWFYFKNKNHFNSSIVALSLLLLQIFFLSPNTKLVFGSARNLDLWRFYLDSARVPGFERFRWNDVLMILLLVGALSNITQKVVKRAGGVLGSLIALIVIGTISILNIVYDFDFVRYFLTIKIYCVALLFLAVGLAIADKGSSSNDERNLNQMMVFFGLGTASLLALAQEFRWGRYGNNNFIPSPGLWVFPLIYFFRLLYSKNINFIRRAPVLIGFLSIIIVPSKTIYLEVFVFVLIYLVYRINPRVFKSINRIPSLLAALIVAVSAGPFIVLFVSLFTSVQLVDVDLSISTRQKQVVNVYETLEGRGLSGLAIGIGHGQWYKVTQEFEEFDTGAWTDEEAGELNYRAATQVPMLSVFRSTGLIGTSVLLLVCFMVARASCFCGVDASNNAFGISITFLTVSIFSQMPELGFESVGIAALNMGQILHRREPLLVQTR